MYELLCMRICFINCHNSEIINQPLTPHSGVDIFEYYDSLPNDTFAQRDFGSHTNAPLEVQGFFSFYKANSNYGRIIYMPISLNVEYTISKSQGQWGEWKARAKKDDLTNIYTEYNVANNNVLFRCTAEDGSAIQLATTGTQIQLQKRTSSSGSFEVVWAK